MEGANSLRKPAVVGLLLLISLWAGVSELLAQSSTASINGTVRDSSGAVVPAAEVILRNTNTNVERKARTNDVGNYGFLNIIPGEYVLEAAKQGFKTGTTDKLSLAVNQTLTQDFALEVGDTKQSITVSAVGAQVQASTSELGAVVDDAKVQSLPLNGRNFTQMLTLTPGVSPVSVSQNSGGFGASPSLGSRFTFPSVNGQSNRSNFFMLDGVNNQGSFVSTYAVPPIIDAIQEFKVQSHNDEAEFGGAIGGIINVVTKSGTNQLHGTVWEYLRNDALDAQNTFLISQEKTPFRQNQFGFSVGGPVVIPGVYNGRNKTFFFVAYEGLRYSTPANSFYRIPTAANLQGDLSDIPNQIFDPFSTIEDPNAPGTFIRQPFVCDANGNPLGSGVAGTPCNKIPQSMLHPTALMYAQQTLPAPRDVGLPPFNGLDTTPLRQTQDAYTFRVDQTIGVSNFLFFRYSGLPQDTTGSGGRETIENITSGHSRNWAINWTKTISPTMVMQMQFGRAHYRYDTSNRFRDSVSSTPSQMGFASNFTDFTSGDPVSLLPAISVANFFSGGSSDDLQPDFTDIYQYKANFSKIFGSHTLKWGGEINSNTFYAVYHRTSMGFQNAQTADPNNLATTGSALASFLLGVPNNAGYQNLSDGTRWGGVMGYYVQDQWKATPRLTVNLGLRYDRTFFPPYGLLSDIGKPGSPEVGDFDFSRGVYILQMLPPTCAERGHAPCIPDPSGQLPANVEVSPNGKIVKDTTRNFQPRVGLAYRATPNTAIRASFGVVFDNWAAISQSSNGFTGRWPDLGSLTLSGLNLPSITSPTPTRDITNPVGQTTALPEPTPFNRSSWYTDPKIENAYSMQWNFGVQRQLNSSTVLTANYVGSGSRRLDIGTVYNTAMTPGPGDSSQRRPYPYITPTWYDRSQGRSSYHAFQFTLDKKYAGGFSYLVSYTWGKSIDLGCSGGWFGIEGCNVRDPYNLNAERGVSAYDLPHIFSASWVYELPFGPNRKYQSGSRVLDHVIGNWQLNGIATFYSGIPYTVLVAGDIANTGNFDTYMRPEVIGDPVLSNPTTSQWINTSAFAAPAQYTFGSLGRNTLRTDGTSNFDLSIFRQFPIGESKRVEFRAEFFNALNTPVYGGPDRVFNSLTFGRVTGTRNASRQIQLGLKIIF